MKDIFYIIVIVALITWLNRDDEESISQEMGLSLPTTEISPPDFLTTWEDVLEEVKTTKDGGYYIESEGDTIYIMIR